MTFWIVKLFKNQEVLTLFFNYVSFLDRRIDNIKPSNEYFKALVFILVGLAICATGIYIYQADNSMGNILFVPQIIGIVSMLYGIYIAYKKWAKV